MGENPITDDCCGTCTNVPRCAAAAAAWLACREGPPGDTCCTLRATVATACAAAAAHALAIDAMIGAARREAGAPTPPWACSLRGS